MSKLMINIPLTKYLQEMARGFGDCFITKTNGGQVWFSSDAPGDMEGMDKGEYKNEVDFSDSDFFTRLPKYVYEHIDIKKGSYKTLKEVIKDIKKAEKENPKLLKESYMIKASDLDKRICDCEDGQTNTETYRDYIRAGEEEFCIAPAPIDEMDDEELQQYLNFMDELWSK